MKRYSDIRMKYTDGIYLNKDFDPYTEIKKREPLVVASHHDADGVYSASLLSNIFKVDKVVFPEVFGDYNTVSINTRQGTKEVEPDVALDLGLPNKEGYDGVIIDHHSSPPKGKEYYSAFGYVPTSAIIYKIFKDKIPDDKKWLVVGSCAGDGQPEKVPVDIWDMCPELLETRGNIFKSYGKFKEYDYALYKQLSSPVNGTCRCGNPLIAYRIVRRAKNPSDVVENIRLQSDKDTVKSEVKSILSEGIESVNVHHLVSVVKIESDLRGIASLLCSKIKYKSKSFDKSWVVVNDSTKKLSIRGDLADYIGEKLQNKGYTCGGHHGFFGGKLNSNQTAKTLMKDLREAFNE